MRTPQGPRAAIEPSDGERRRSGEIWLGGIGGKNVANRRRAGRMRVAFAPLGQSRQVGRNIGRGGLSGEAAERTLIAAMAGRRVLAGGALIVDSDAKLRRVAKNRLGGDRGVIGAGESGRGKRGRRRSCE